MDYAADIAVLKVRLATAETQRNTWRAAGTQEKYLEACSMVDALELQIGALVQTARRAALIAALPPEPAPSVAKVPAESPAERERLMAEFAISFNGRHYQYGRHRYGLLANAVNYAQRQRSNSGPNPRHLLGAAPPQAAEVPSEAQRKLMSSVAITFQDGVYRLGDYRYDRLADALDYANLKDRA
jgi:hypothetical protein